ncbi:hypothetical protein ACFWA6_31085 [Streptomyces sp. NPDC060020]|uniref:hypothetical protein n=1 Tax=Streptomyces sp. NPDC060020 TaxID=3347038 RepID=UPI0036C5C4B1
MRRRTPIQSAIRSALEQANTVEPYPVHVGWERIARQVYGRHYVSQGDVRNIQRVAERMWDVQISYFQGGRRRAGAFLTPTPAQRWIKWRIWHAVPAAGFLVEASEYRPPTPDDVLKVFLEGCSEEVLKTDLLVQIVSLVNKHCGSAFDPSEVAWWRVGLEQQRHRDRQALYARFHRAVGEFSAEKDRLETEARKVDFGPVRIDPLTVTHCPCCHQRVAPGFLPVQRAAVPAAAVAR